MVWYAVRRWPLRWVLQGLDLALARLRPTGTDAPPAEALQPRRVLLCMQAHLGDAVLATAVLPPLQRRFPDARFGMLVHPDALPAVRSHPALDWLHTVEHWHLNRRDRGAWRRWRRHRASRAAALQEIRAVGYDLAIDLYHYFPNSVALLARSGIPWRMGWRSGGAGPTLSHPLDHDGRPEAVLDRHARVLRAFGVPVHPPLRPDLPVDAASRARWQALAAASGLPPEPVLLHVGAHAAHRRWPTSGWIALARALVAEGRAVALLGRGADEAAITAAVAAAVPQVVDLADRLDWSTLVAAVSQARALVSHDSAAAHLGTAFDRPRVCLAAGINDLRIWLREDARSRVLSRPVPCAPCGRTGGCAAMTCIRGVEAPAVIEAVRQLPSP